MGVTRFPDGIEVGSQAGVAATFSIGGTAYNPVSSASVGVKIGALAGTVITGGGTIGGASFTPALTTVVQAVGGLGGTGVWAGTASTLPAYVVTAVVGGSAIVYVYDAQGVKATQSGTIAILAFGT